MGCGVWWRGYNVLTESLDKFGQWGIPETDPGYQSVWGKIQEWLKNVGRKLPRISITVKVTFGHSPGIFTLKLDPETGFFVEARERPGTPPIYRAIGDDLARAIYLEELTEEQEAFLLTPDPYLGE